MELVMGADLPRLIEQGLGYLLLPARFLLESAGLHPLDMQAWALMVAIFMVALLAPTTYGDFVLQRRQRRAMGTVISIDNGTETTTPRIGFRDGNGRQVEFDSPLSVNHRTEVIGGAVEVIYDPLNPKRAREAGRLVSRITIALVWYGLAIALLVFAVAGGEIAAGG